MFYHFEKILADILDPLVPKQWSNQVNLRNMIAVAITFAEENTKHTTHEALH